MRSTLLIPDSSIYALQNAHIPTCLLESKQQIQPQTTEGLSLVDLIIVEGKIKEITPSYYANQVREDMPTLDLAKKIILPCLVDIHTHLDKGHIWERSPNTAGTFEMALQSVNNDASNKHYSRCLSSSRIWSRMQLCAW